MREKTDLCGTWKFQPDPPDEGEAGGYHAAEYDDSRWPAATIPSAFEDCMPERPPRADRPAYSAWCWAAIPWPQGEIKSFKGMGTSPYGVVSRSRRRLPAYRKASGM